MSDPTGSHPCDPDTNAPVWVTRWNCPACGWPYDLVVQIVEREIFGRPTKLAFEVWQRRTFA